jgi:hypothetical protein
MWLIIRIIYNFFAFFLMVALNARCWALKLIGNSWKDIMKSGKKIMGFWMSMKHNKKV